ncbi:MAG: phosphoribosylformylglycinamidine synthase subunit PurQ, partial [Eubacterium sp.]|nr:phosphoribosylformylglycinamidine synthase subunit PurQ [Eubacterium sp.]
DIDVPPTLVSFAVDVGHVADVITPELKQAGSKLVWIRIPRDDKYLPDYEGVMDLYDRVHQDMQAGRVLSAYALNRFGIAQAVSKMAFGNHLGVRIEHNVDARDLFSPAFGDLILEIPDGQVGNLACTYTVVGEVTESFVFEYCDTVIDGMEALEKWSAPLNNIFRQVSGAEPNQIEVADAGICEAKDVHICAHKLAQPTVFIPVFPGSNCEFDSAKAFERAGAKVETKVFRNLSANDIFESVDLFAKTIDQAQIIMFPGGFSAGDEPDGSAKFFATAFQNAKIKEAVTRMLETRDGLALGICNGFQALIKLGLVPHGAITGQQADSPTLTFNTIGRHISKMAYTRVVSNKSPWLRGTEAGGIYTVPASHGEGRFVANKEWIEKLQANGQIATRYCDLDGNFTDDEYWNINGSYFNIEGITSPDGRVFGKMCHAERIGSGVAINIYGEQDMKIFESGVEYFR